MSEDIFSRPSGKVESNAIRQEPETRSREFRSPFPHQHAIKLGLERVQMQHIGRRIIDLRFRQLLGAPVG